jgi:amino-acid N-acetyltransferase
VLRAGVGVLLMPPIRPATADDAGAIRAMLVDGRLPVEDLDAAPVAFFVADQDDAVLGVVGIEPYGDAALLRSLAVAPGRRQHGVGESLVAAAETYARSLGIGQLVLLTTTAAPFFAKRGYVGIARDAAPASVRASAEFLSICPASATCMAKTLEASP